MRLAVLVAVLIATFALPGAGAAAVLGRMSATRGGETLAYRLTDAAGAGSGWQRNGNTVAVLLDWQGPAPTDRLVLELTLAGDKPGTAQLELPEALGGALAAKAPGNLHLELHRISWRGSWLRLTGALRATLRPSGVDSGTLDGGSVALHARFSAWVPGIFAPAPAPTGKKG